MRTLTQIEGDCDSEIYGENVIPPAISRTSNAAANRSPAPLIDRLHSFQLPSNRVMAWRSMFDHTCREQMLARLRRLTPDSPRRWGRMTAPQMIAHLTDQMHHALGDSPVAARPGFLRWRPVKYASIYILPWPKGRIKGPREAFVTEPTTWPADIAVLEELIQRFVAHDQGDSWPEHALMGQMNGRDWGVFVHKHFDHHLRQFGC